MMRTCRHYLLFFADSDDDESSTQAEKSVAHNEEVPMEVDGKTEEIVGGRASSVSSSSSKSPPNSRVPSRSSPAPEGPSEETPAKKRKLSPDGAPYSKEPKSAYLGSFLVGNAWSNVRGKGYIKSGDEIREELEDTVVGLTNKADFEFGRIPQDVSSGRDGRDFHSNIEMASGRQKTCPF
ncbi:unnamed protein product [Somion occarium]|uniref:Uncharacterized protein n=1 Tax=Somion occarium TaxID=3059160 RepID=A0ABP1E0T5_9APHY